MPTTAFHGFTDAGNSPNAASHFACIAVISVYDPGERVLPDVGLIKIADAESGREDWVDTSSKSVRDYFNSWNRDVSASIRQTLNRYKVDSVSISTNEDFVKGLVALFKNR